MKFVRLNLKQMCRGIITKVNYQCSSMRENISYLKLRRSNILKKFFTGYLNFDCS